ncbi:hypothetical protein QCA50_014393 [Cerrena zonata]|uniref:Uncharacterized protein n=1 Tax=Cerrena zonata TaxID=2478898 RepID=A0AAW0FYB2_9APHY
MCRSKLSLITRVFAEVGLGFPVISTNIKYLYTYDFAPIIHRIKSIYCDRRQPNLKARIDEIDRDVLHLSKITSRRPRTDHNREYPDFFGLFSYLTCLQTFFNESCSLNKEMR